MTDKIKKLTDLPQVLASGFEKVKKFINFPFHILKLY